jgi:hypothetical protein
MRSCATLPSATQSRMQSDAIAAAEPNEEANSESVREQAGPIAK